MRVTVFWKEPDMVDQLKKFCREPSGSGTLIGAIAMMAVLGVSALVVDIGHLVSVKGELQRAVDAGALAGARALWPMALPVVQNPPANPDCVSAKGIAQTTATSVANQVDGEALTAANLTIDVGNYDYATRKFTQKTDCTLTSNAVRVKANKIVNNVFFARIWNITSLNPQATAIGTMGFAKAVGKGTIPIAINKMYVNPGTSVFINFSPDPSDNGGWFANPPDKSGASTFKDYITEAACAPLKIGDIISLQNGTDTTCFDALKAELEKHTEGYWDTFLPVVDTEQFNQPEPIVAFVPFRITNVVDTGSCKGVEGTVIGLAECGGALPGSDVNCGALAPPKAVN
jgi:Flp pilus assembly protein TadG